MSSAARFRIARPVLMLTDYQGGESFRSLAALDFNAGQLLATIGRSATPTSPTAVSGATFSLDNLVKLLLNSAGSVKAPPLFSVPLLELPNFQTPATGQFNFGVAPPSRPNDPVDGLVPVRFMTDPAAGSTRIEVASSTVLSSPAPVPFNSVTITINLPEGAPIGETRVDSAGQPWLDISILSLIANVTSGANVLSFGMVPGQASFFIDFGGMPITFNDSPVSSLGASVILDRDPNFAPRLTLNGGEIAKSYVVEAGVPLDFGADLFFDHRVPAPSGTHLPSAPALLDPSLNLAASTSSTTSATSFTTWFASNFRPVLVAEPESGELRIQGQGTIRFPSIDASEVISIDTLAVTGPSAAQIGASFVRFGGEVYRALLPEELARLQFHSTGIQALAKSQVPISILLRDAAGALSGEFFAKANVIAAAMSGETLFWGNDAPLESVSVVLQPVADPSREPVSRVSSGNGIWSASGLDFGQYAVQAEWSSRIDGGQHSVHAADLLAGLKLTQGRSAIATQGPDALVDFSKQSYQLAAADIDGDGLIEPVDLERIAQLALGTSDFSAVQWRFLPAASPTYLGVSESASGLVVDASDHTQLVRLRGVLIGDVDGSWSSSSAILDSTALAADFSSISGALIDPLAPA